MTEIEQHLRVALDALNKLRAALERPEPKRFIPDRVEAPVRTEEEARRSPMRGDRWQTRPGSVYTLTRPHVAGVWKATGDLPQAVPGLPHETYLGNFAHELPESE